MEHQHNEFTLVKKLMIMLVLIELVFAFFSAMTLSSITGGIGCTTSNSNNPACAVQNNQDQITSTSNSLFNSYDCVLNNQNNTSCAIRTSGYTFSTTGTGCLFSGCPITNFYYGTVAVGVGILNAIVGFATMLAYALALIAEIFLLIFLPFTIIPAIFQQANLGSFAQIFQYLYGGVTIIILGYVGCIILNRIRGN